MNKNNYMKSMDHLKVSEDFNERTAKLMKKTRDESKQKSHVMKKMAYSAASIAAIIAVGATAIHMTNTVSNHNDNTIKIQNTQTADHTVTTDTASDTITIPAVELPESQSTEIKGRMLPLFVYKEHIYIQSSTTFFTADGTAPDKEEVLKLRGDLLGTTKESIDEWSSQDDYAKEFASNLGEGGKVYTVKGYDSNYRLMVYFEYPDGFDCNIYDSLGGLTLKNGADYFNLLNLKDNSVSYTWESYDSWNNGKSEVKEVKADDAFHSFLNSLYNAVPIGENTDMLVENTDYDSQKFITIKTKDNLNTTLRLFKGGYVYDTQAGFFKVDDNAFHAFWDTMPLTVPANTSETAAGQETVTAQITLTKTAIPEGSKKLTLELKNNGTEDVFYGSEFSIEILNGTNWEVVPAVSNLMFTEIAYTLTAGSSKDFVIDLSSLNPILTAGNYRVVKNMNGVLFYAEFEITK